MHRALRRRVQRALAERLRFETLLSDLSAMFAAGPVSAGGPTHRDRLRCIVEEFGVDRTTVRDLSGPDGQARVRHSWTRAGGPSPVLPSEGIRWITSRLRQGQTVRLSRPEELPLEAVTDRQTLHRLGTRSPAAVPLIVGGSVEAFLSVGTLREERDPTVPVVMTKPLRVDGSGTAQGRIRRPPRLDSGRLPP